jgi:ribonuclease HII
VAAVAWADSAPTAGLADSKQLSAKKRQQMVGIIRLHAVGIGIGWVTAPEIDRIGMTAALKKAAKQAVLQIGLIAPIIMDGRDKLLAGIPAEYIIKADTKVPAVMAASIIAKVARDTYMHTVDKQFAAYGFAKHVGYGTLLHRQMIAQFGPCAQHRLSYAPLKKYAVL